MDNTSNDIDAVVISEGWNGYLLGLQVAIEADVPFDRVVQAMVDGLDRILEMILNRHTSAGPRFHFNDTHIELKVRLAPFSDLSIIKLEWMQDAYGDELKSHMLQNDMEQTLNNRAHEFFEAHNKGADHE